MSKLKLKFIDGCIHVTGKDARKLRGRNLVYDKDFKSWKTPFVTLAKTLFPKAPSVKKLQAYRKKIDKKEISISCLSSPPLKNYQIEGAKALVRYKRVLLADDMGLGKTVQAIAAINTVEPDKCLIVCPASLKQNWKNEIENWQTWLRDIQVINGSDEFDADKDTYIINYDILNRHEDYIKSIEWDFVVLDESHYLKNPGTIRTNCVYGARGKQFIKAKYVAALTGTPILARPSEIFTALRYLCPQGFSNRSVFERRYCDAHIDFMGRYDASGSSREEELNAILKEFVMVRRLKSEVLSELPEKTRQSIILNETKEARQERKFLDKMGIESIADFKKLKKATFSKDEHIMTVRRLTGLAKYSQICEHIQSYVDAGKKLVVFAVHKELIKKLSSKFKNSVTLTGDTPTNKRQSIVDKFQNDESIKLFFGNIQAAGVGITLTAASNALIVELPWSPSELIQAEDRLHRISQKSNVHIKYLIFEGTIDVYILQMLSKKSETIKSILD